MSAVFFDVDTQFDFVNPSGALYAPGAERILDAVSRLNRYAAAHSIPVVLHYGRAPGERPGVFRLAASLRGGNHRAEEARGHAARKPRDVPNCDGDIAVAGAPQIILEKQTVDVFQTRTILRVLEALNADCYVVYGVVTGGLSCCTPFKVAEDRQTGDGSDQRDSAAER